MLDRWQEAGVDTNYIRKLKMSRMVYLGYYGYFQQHDMTFPVSVNNADIPLDMRYMPPNLSEKKYMATDMHTYQTEVELGIDWRGIALEIPIPIRNRYSMSFGLAKTLSATATACLSDLRKTALSGAHVFATSRSRIWMVFWMTHIIRE